MYRCYTLGTLKNQAVYLKVRARHTVRRACLYLISLSPFLGLSLSLSHWSDHAVSALVEDAHVPLWLQHNESVSHEKGAI